MVNSVAIIQNNTTIIDEVFQRASISTVLNTNPTWRELVITRRKWISARPSAF